MWYLQCLPVYLPVHSHWLRRAQDSRSTEVFVAEDCAWLCASRGSPFQTPPFAGHWRQWQDTEDNGRSPECPRLVTEGGPCGCTVYENSPGCSTAKSSWLFSAFSPFTPPFYYLPPFALYLPAFNGRDGGERKKRMREGQLGERGDRDRQRQRESFWVTACTRICESVRTCGHIDVFTWQHTDVRVRR